MNLSENIIVSKNGFVFDASSGDSFLCNSIGMDIVNYFKAGKSEDETRQIILAEYEISDLELNRDMDEFIAMLRRFNLVL